MSCDAVLWELTWRCDRACAHCYNVWRHGVDYPIAELGHSELRRLADRIMETFSPRTVTVIGGEPLMHERCVDVVDHLSRRGVAVAMSTHGGLVDEQTARGLALAGLRAAEVSLCPEACDDAKLSAACRALALLGAQGIACTASVVLARPFLPRIGELVARAAAFGAIGVSIHPLIEPFPGALPDRLVPEAHELMTALQEISECSARAGMPARLSYPPGTCRVPESAAGLAASCCPCDGSRPVVDPAGNVRRCEADRVVGGNVRRDTPASPRSRPQQTPECASCDRTSCRRPCPFLARR